MISPSKDVDEETMSTPSPKTPPDHHLSGHVNLSFEPYIFQPSTGVPFYYTPYSNAWDQNYREEENIFTKLKYPMAFCCFVLVIAIVILIYLLLGANFVSTIKNPKV